MKKLCMVVMALWGCHTGMAQVRPKLVVGVMIDQMRWDYLYRYADRYGPGGFRRLMNEGFNCDNTFINYTPTYTAPGHASVYTGSVPAMHGIAGNYWYDRLLRRSVYCTEDDSVQTVGSSSTAGRQSPRNLWANTISDEMRLSTNFRSKTIAVAVKDRGSVLPGGHTANGAYWYDGTTGSFITSSFYMSQLPSWVTEFNNQKRVDAFLKESWKPLYPINTYVQSTRDAAAYEDVLPGEDNTFDHETGQITTGRYSSFLYTPAANTYTFEMAKAAIRGEDLGKDAFTDMLAVSFSATDYAGHRFGPNSIEMEDMFLRFDKDLASFLSYLDVSVGKGQYVLFLTADHGVAQVPGFMRENKLPAGLADDAPMVRNLNDSINKKFGLEKAIVHFSNYQFYLDDAVLARWKGDRNELDRYIVGQLLKHPAVSHAFELSSLGLYPLPAGIREMVANGYSPVRSGNFQVLLKPQWFDGGTRGTTHGSWNPYDAHIPLLWFGTGVQRGKLHRTVHMTDIAPTLAAMLGIQMPNATVGKVIEEILPPARGSDRR